MRAFTGVWGILQSLDWKEHDGSTPIALNNKDVSHIINNHTDPGYK